MSDNYLDHRGFPRIVITGMGAFTPIGNTLEQCWASLMHGRSGIDVITQFDAAGPDLPCQIAGEVKDFDPTDYLPRKEVRRMARASQLAVAAAREALNDAGFKGTVPNPERSATVLGTGLGGYEFSLNSYDTYREKGFARVLPYSLISSLPNLPCHHVSVEAQTLGPISTVVTACASGTQAIGEAAELIRHGRADLVLAGGVEAVITEVALVGFAAMRGLPTEFNDNPQAACKPFDKNRSGFVYSEGAGVLVLERLDQALERGATIYAELVGHASSSDAFHIAALDPDGAGAVRAMQWAIDDAGIERQQIDYINAHGTGTALNDVTETTAIKTLFEEHAYELVVSSTKSLTGHAMGGAGALEAIFSALALVHQKAPGTYNYETPDPECDLDYAPNAPREMALAYVLSNSFGLGGQNACLVLKRYDEPEHGRGPFTTQP
ncbi:MAG: beta-ketoacyl-ACP synthase II [Anaerolineales bacterium]|nr:beta-ketoacyl-ACP synthase II [Anaerolineales bacterium]